MMNTTSNKIRSVVSRLLIIVVLTACAPAGNPVPTPTPTSPPTQSTEMPLPGWVTDFGDPILLAVQDRPPDFQDDFSQNSDQWRFDVTPDQGSGKMEIANGVLTVNVEPGQIGMLANDGIEFKNFILQIDVSFQSSPLNEFQINWGQVEENHENRIFALGINGWRLMECGSYDCTIFTSGPLPISLSDPVTIIVVSKGTEFEIYMNGVPLTYYNNIEAPARSGIGLFLFSGESPANSEISIDNLRIWNLETVFPSPAASPTPAPWIADFSAPLLYAIQDRPPDFQDDFSESDTGWVFITGHGDGTVEIASGVMTMGAVSGQNAVATHKKMTLYNFILQVDITFLDLEDQISADIFWRQYNGIAEVFSLQNDGRWALKRYDRPDFPVFASGSESADLTKPVTITIVSRGTEFAVYLNNVPLAFHNDLGRPPANGIQLQLLNLGDNKINSAIALDNLKVWNLDSISLLSITTPAPTATPHPLVASFGDPILLAIQDRPPDFQDDFSQGSTGWITSPGGAVNIANGILTLSGGAGQGVDYVKVPRINFTNFVVQVDMNTQKMIYGCEATIQWRGGADGPGRIFGLQNGKWSLYSIYQSQDDLPFPTGIPTNGPLPLSATGAYTITLISKDPEIAVYLNDEPITYVMDIVRPPDPGFYFGLWYPDFCIAEYDNLKVWDFDKLE